MRLAGRGKLERKRTKYDDGTFQVISRSQLRQLKGIGALRKKLKPHSGVSSGSFKVAVKHDPIRSPHFSDPLVLRPFLHRSLHRFQFLPGVASSFLSFLSILLCTAPLPSWRYGDIAQPGSASEACLRRTFPFKLALP